MKEYVCILRDGELMDLATIDIMDGGRKRKNDIALRTARRKYGSYNKDRRCHVRSHYTNNRRVAELPLRNYQRHERCFNSQSQSFATNRLQVWQRNEFIIRELLAVFTRPFQLLSEFILNIRPERKEIQNAG